MSAVLRVPMSEAHHTPRIGIAAATCKKRGVFSIACPRCGVPEGERCWFGEKIILGNNSPGDKAEFCAVLKEARLRKTAGHRLKGRVVRLRTMSALPSRAGSCARAYMT